MLSAAFGRGTFVQYELEESCEDGDLLGIQTVVEQIIILACDDQSRLFQDGRLFPYLLYIHAEHLGKLGIGSVAF